MKEDIKRYVAVVSNLILETSDARMLPAILYTVAAN